MTDIKRTLSRFLGFFAAVKEINEKYKTPRIKMTRMVKISLIALRLYLIFMIAILLYKFILVAFGK